MRFALCREDATLMRAGQSTLAELAASVSKTNIVLLIAAVDVTLLELSVPPMPESKLRLAMPNLVEDQLMSDSSESVLVPVGLAVAGTGRRVVAVTQRGWLQQLSASLFVLGAHHIKAVPAQLCLPWQPGSCSAQIEDGAPEASLTLRSHQDQGIGMLQQVGQLPVESLTTLMLLAPAGPILLQVPAQSLDVYQAAIAAHPDWQDRLSVSGSDWTTLIQGCKTAGVNLMVGLNQAQAQRMQWQLWRWPLVLALLVLIVNSAALNYDYWSLKREVQSFKQGMIQTYRSSFPKDTVVAYPLEQMRKNIDLAARASGQPSNDDFTLLLSRFGAAWTSPIGAPLPKLVSIDYKDHALLIQVKGTLPQKQLQQALDARDLVLKKNSAEVWQVRNAQ